MLSRMSVNTSSETAHQYTKMQAHTVISKIVDKGHYQPARFITETLGVHSSTTNRKMSGESPYTTWELECLAEKLGISVVEFFPGLPEDAAQAANLQDAA